MTTDTALKPLHVADPAFSPDEEAEVLKGMPDILRNKLSMGPHVAAFESEFADAVDATHAVGVNACTSALEIALTYKKLTPNDEVIVPAQTFIATGMAVHLAQAKPVFADINPDTFCLDYETVMQKFTPKTKAIILVHYLGYVSPDAFKIRAFCDANDILLIEDAAHTPGASLDGKSVGTIGHVACFSFYPTKILTCGEGGMLTTNDANIYEYARSLQHRGRGLSLAGEQYTNAGRNIRLTETSALMGRVKLKGLKKNIQIRRDHADAYTQQFAGLNQLSIFKCTDTMKPAYWKFPILLDPACDRDRILNRLHEQAVFADACYQPPIHLQPFFQTEYGYQAGDLARSEALMARHICLPCHDRLSETDVARIADTVIHEVQS